MGKASFGVAFDSSKSTINSDIVLRSIGTISKEFFNHSGCAHFSNFDYAMMIYILNHNHSKATNNQLSVHRHIEAKISNARCGDY